MELPCTEVGTMARTMRKLCNWHNFWIFDANVEVTTKPTTRTMSNATTTTTPITETTEVTMSSSVYHSHVCSGAVVAIMLLVCRCVKKFLSFFGS